MIDGASAAEDAAIAGDRIAAILARGARSRPATASGSASTLATGSAELEPGDDAATLIARAFEQLQPFGLRQAS